MTTPSGSKWQTAKRAGDRAASSVANFPGQVTKRRAHHHLLLTEYLLFCLVVVLRAAADYVPASGGTVKGSSPPASSGQLAPLPLFAAGTGLFFLLSFPASQGGPTGALANGFGGIVILALVMRSGPELQTVAGWYKAIGGGTTTSTEETT